MRATRAISREHDLGVGDVLEDLGRGDEVELVVGEQQVLGLHRAELEVRAPALRPLGLELGVLEVDSDHAARVERWRPTGR